MQAKSQTKARSLVGLLALCASCAAALLLALFSSSARAAGCANEAIRAEQGAAALALPDCRAYELVSPGSTPFLISTGEVLSGRASPAGGSLFYESTYPAEGSVTSTESWRSKRTATGWAVEGLGAQMTPMWSKSGICTPGIAVSEDLESYVLAAGGDLYRTSIFNPSGECGMPAEELVAGEPRGYSNLYLAKGNDPFALLNPVLAGGSAGNATYQAAASDLSRVVFSEDAQLTPGSPLGYNLFIWADGVVRLVGVLPNGESVPARLGAGTQEWGDYSGIYGGSQYGLAPVSHAVSTDGERVFFEANGNLYLRENAGQDPAADANCRTTTEPELACTLQLDRSFGAGEHGGGVFQFASRDGSKVFFTSDHQLKSPSSAEPGKHALYEYRVDSRELVDLTVNPAKAVADVRGFSGGSDNGSHLYFVARGALTGGEQNARGEEAQAKEPNLYLAEEGKVTYVATLSPWEESGGKDIYTWWRPKGSNLRTAWSPDGEYLLFSSVKALTDFDNSPAPGESCSPGPGCAELFLYDAKSKALSCVSCDLGGSKPVANTQVTGKTEAFRLATGSRYFSRAVLDSGQVFFETGNALSPQDVNGFGDTYEYRSGNLNLVSSGSADGASAFVDSSADGQDVFIVTAESLVRADRDGGLPSLYDARVNGGFVEPPLPPAPCGSDESCRTTGPVSPPAQTSPSTATFAGQGNVRPSRCKHGRVRRGGRCVRKANHRHSKHRNSTHGAGRSN